MASLAVAKYERVAAVGAPTDELVSGFVHQLLSLQPGGFAETKIGIEVLKPLRLMQREKRTNVPTQTHACEKNEKVKCYGRSSIRTEVAVVEAGGLEPPTSTVRL